MADSHPDPGEGYRLLDPEERVLSGDQYFFREEWTLSYNAEYNGGYQSPGLVYRRKVTEEDES